MAPQRTHSFTRQHILHKGQAVAGRMLSGYRRLLSICPIEVTPHQIEMLRDCLVVKHLIHISVYIAVRITMNDKVARSSLNGSQPRLGLSQVLLVLNQLHLAIPIGIIRQCPFQDSHAPISRRVIYEYILYIIEALFHQAAHAPLQETLGIVDKGNYRYLWHNLFLKKMIDMVNEPQGSIRVEDGLSQRTLCGEGSTMNRINA